MSVKSLEYHFPSKEYFLESVRVLHSQGSLTSHLPLKIYSIKRLAQPSSRANPLGHHLPLQNIFSNRGLIYSAIDRSHQGVTVPPKKIFHECTGDSIRHNQQDNNRLKHSGLYYLLGEGVKCFLPSCLSFHGPTLLAKHLTTCSRRIRH